MIVDAGDARAHVDPHRRRLDDLGVPRLRAAQHRPDPLDQLLVRERPLDVVVAASPERVDAVDGVGVLAPDHDHRHSLDPPVDRVDVAGEHEIEGPPATAISKPSRRRCRSRKPRVSGSASARSTAFVMHDDGRARGA